VNKRLALKTLSMIALLLLPAVARRSEAYSTTGYDWWLPQRGGNSGSPPEWLGCNPGDVVVGLYASWGDYIERVGLICSTLNQDGSFGPRYTTRILGGSGGKPGLFYQQCPDGQAVVAIDGWFGSYVDQYEFTCSPPPFTERTHGWYPLGAAHGGGFASDDCHVWQNPTAGYVVDGFNVRHGSWVDALQPRCVYIAP
jgi:hypothetical protein